MKRIIALLVLFVLIFGCIGPAPPQPPAANNTTIQEPAKMPNFIIVTPKSGEVFTTAADSIDVMISLSTTDLLLKQPGSQPKSGEGHFHIILDNQQPLHVSTKSYTLANVGAGEHTLKIELVNNDHGSYLPKIIKTVSFTVEKQAVQQQPITVEVNIGDFNYDPSEVTIKVNDSVKWLNKGKFPRSITATDQSFNKMLNIGENYTNKFTKAGVYNYSSTNWPDMKGKIIVE